MKSEIFKVQRAIAGADTVLIYNQDRSKLGQIPMTESIKELFEPNEFKIFVRGKMQPDGKIAISQVVEEQDW